MQAVSKKISRFQNIQTAGGKTVNEPYIFCKISIRSQEKCLANFIRSLFYNIPSVYSALVFVAL